MRLFEGRVAVLMLCLGLLPVTLESQQISDYFTVAPCRLYDSRWGDGPMVGGFDRWVPVGSHCGIPPDATAATLNITAVTPTGDGMMSAYPCCAWRPNYTTAVQNGNNIAGSAYLAMGQDGKLAAYLNAAYSTSAELVVDVSGYFRPVSEVQQWREWEGTLTSPEDYTANGGDPYADVDLSIRFSNVATGVSFLQPAVWWGEDTDPRTFKVWMALPAGTWTWAAPDGLKYPWVGDTAWLAPVREQAPGATSYWDAYLTDRKSKGFTGILIAPAIAYWTSTLPQPGGFSFRKKSASCTSPVPNRDCWQPRKQYWSSFRNMVRKANEAGMVVVVAGVMNPAGININDTYPDTASARKFATYLKGLLGSANVIFSPAFDDDPGDKNGSRGALMDEVGLALRSSNQTGRSFMLTNHLSGGKSNCDEYYAFANPADPAKRWMSFYLFHSGHGGGPNPDLTGPCALVSTNSDVDNALMRARVMSSTLSGYTNPALPAVNGEGPYDAKNYTGTVNHPDVDTRYRVRQAGYLSMLSNAFGFTYGAYGITDWVAPNTFFNLDSAKDMTILKQSFQDRSLISHPDWILNQQTPEKYKMVLASDNSSYVLAYLPGDETGRGTSSEAIQIAPNLPCPVCPSLNSAAWSFAWLNPIDGRSFQEGSCSGQKGGPLTFRRPECKPDNGSCDWLLKIEKTGACPSAAAGSDSSEAVLQAWTAEEASHGGTTAVYAGETGPVGPVGMVKPILLSSAGKAFQMAPRVSRLGSHHLVVWQADGLDGSLYGIYGSLVGPRGEVTGPFKINDYTEHDQREPAVAGRRAQEALVVWSSYGQDGDRGGIFGRLVRVKDHGQEPVSDNLGVEFPISEEPAGHQQRPQVAIDAAGYWVAWETLDEQDQRRSLSVRRFGRNGSPQAPEVRLEAPAGEQRQLLTLDRPGPESVVLRWLRQDAVGRLLEVLEQEVGRGGALGSAVPGRD